MSSSASLRSLERRVTASYLSAFGAVLVIFVVAVHLAFAFQLDRDARHAFDTLLGQARGAVEARNGRLHLDADDVQIADPRSASVRWFDARGDVMASVGGFAREPGVPSLLERVPAPALPSLAGLRVPTDIEVAYSLASSRATLAKADLGLGLGLIVSLVAAGIGGAVLARRSIGRVASTLRALRDFTGDAAHELRGPLAALSSNAAASLRDDVPLAEVHRGRLTTIAATASDLARMVDDLLLIARAETPIERDLFAIDVRERITGVVEARRVLARDAQLALSVAACDARVYGNPVEFDRIVGNLLDNALRYTSAGGSVWVESTLERGGVAVRVRDTGVGIASGDLAKIFERFWRADGVRSHDGGTGLGLAIARALARRHGGDISVQSVPGSGSTFCLWLPMRPPPVTLRDLSTIRT